jgi:putative exporter of polyketide antibiotics
MLDFTKILFGLIDQEYYYLITPLSLLIVGFVIKLRAQGNTYIGRLTMFSNSMALLSFYAFIPHLPLLMIWLLNISVVLGVIGIISYAKVEHRLPKQYYDVVRFFDSIYVALLILLYYIFPTLFV